MALLSLVSLSGNPPLLSSTAAASAFEKQRRHAATAKFSLMTRQTDARSRLATSFGQTPELSAAWIQQVSALVATTPYPSPATNATYAGVVGPTGCHGLPKGRVELEKTGVEQIDM